MTNPFRSFVLLVSLLCTFAILGGTALPGPALAAPTSVPIIGEIESLTLTDPNNVYSGGRMVVGGTIVVLPKNLLIDLPANRLTLQQIFTQAPGGCVALGQSGLAKNDTCNPSGTGGIATLTAVYTNNGDVIAGDVFLQKGIEAVTGQVTYINYTDGYFRVNGLPNDPATGTMLRLNDPTGRHTIQQGLGCAGGPNCSADPRFTLDPDNYVIAFSTGYPVCIPSMVSRATKTTLPASGLIPAIPAGTLSQAASNGTGDILCPSSNRTPGAVVENPVNDSRRFAPLMLGDSVTAEGNFETIGGTRFVSVHTMRVNKALGTRNDPTQPDYLFLEEVFVEAPAFQNQRARTLIIGFTTLAPTDVDFWSIHRDPVSNAIHEFPLASIQGCDAVGGAGTCGSLGLAGAGAGAGANIFRIRYDVDFLLGNPANPGFIPGGAKDKLNPCLQLQASPRFSVSNPGLCSNTLADNFAILSPIPHEIQARTGHSLAAHPAWITLDVNGYPATSGQYLFPFGMNLGGIETADFLEVDINLINTPKSFEGVPWNLDRRLSPGGCLNGCEATPQPLDPFPYTGLDPRTQADGLGGGLPGGTPKGSYSNINYTFRTLSSAADRVLSYVSGTASLAGKYNFDGNNTVLPLTLAVDPGPQGVIAPITVLPLACIAGGIAPVAQNDTAVTNTGVAVTIPVLFNDNAPVGVINFAGVVVSLASHGTVTANLDGTVTYLPYLLPVPGFAGTDTFTYTVPELTSGAISNVATVTVTVIGQPVANSDSAVTNKNVPAVVLALANDAAPADSLNPASILVTQPATGLAAANVDGTITYTPTTGFSGNDTFTYTVANTVGTRSNAATVSVIVNNVNTLPFAVYDAVSTSPSTTVVINVLANDQAFGTTFNTASVLVSALTPSTMGSVVSDLTGSVTYVPAPGFTGPASFAYTVSDVLSQTSNTAIVSIIVSSPPTATPDSATTLEDTPVTFDLALNDVAQIGGIVPSSVTIKTEPAKGVVTNLGTGSVTYTPNLNTNGIDTFTYTVSDTASGVSLPGIVTVNVTPVNDPPTAVGLNKITAEDIALPITLIGTDPDINDILTYTITGGPLLHGTLTGTPPNMTYTPNLNFNGPASFTYTVSDGVLTSAPATVNITVTPVNDAPITVNDTANTPANVAVAINVLANDTDVDGTIAVNTISVTQSPNGLVTVNGVTGVVTFTPNLNFTGAATFKYTVADNLGAVSAFATVTVNVATATGTVTVARAQFTTVTANVSGDWRIEGTGTPGALVTLYVGSTITIPGSAVIGTITIDAAGVWKFAAANLNVLPDANNTVSVRTSTGATRLAFPAVVK